MYRISIIGSGNVAWHLAQALENAGHIIEEVWSRNPKNSAALVDHLYGARVQEHLDFSQSLSNVFIISVADKALEEVVHQLILPPDVLLVHTSGTLPMELLKPASENFGVFYPLQTFSKEKAVYMAEVPFCLEAVGKSALKQLKKMAGSLSENVHLLDSSKRKAVHLAAVFACNFTNHMLRISEEVLKGEDIDPEILHPLIAETIEKSMEIGAKKAQTGPAVREDMQVITTHLEQLEANPQWAEMYHLISQDIIQSKKSGA